jgi:hypothetical protein
MTFKLPPAPTGVPPGHAFWNDWYEKLRTLVALTAAIDWTIVTNTPTTLAGYGVTKVDVPGDIISDDSTKGLVLQSPNAHYWRATISNAGVVTWTDLGTTKP